MAEFDYSEAISEARAKYESISKALDVDRLTAEAKDLEVKAAEPGLWDDPENAQKVTSKLSAVQSQLKRLASADQRIEDVETLVELGQEEEDADTLAEAKAEVESIQKDLDDMEIQTLLDGEYDERSAVVTIRSGAGGVDAADFAQMLLRMYLRWAERNGYKAKVMDTSYAEEAGIKSATFQVDAPYAYGRLSVEGGTHRLVRISPFDNQGRRQTSFAAVEVMPELDDDSEIEIRPEDIEMQACRSSGAGFRNPRRHLLLVRSWRTGREHHVFRGAHHPHSDRHRGDHAGRTLSDSEPRRRHGRAAVPTAGAAPRGGSQEEEGARRRHQGQLGRPDALVCAASVPDGQGPAHGV